MSRFLLMISLTLLICGCTGRTEPTWLDSYGEEMCRFFEKRAEMLESATDEESTDGVAKKLREMQLGYDALRRKALSQANTERRENRKLNETRRKELFDRVEAALEKAEFDVKRLRAMALDNFYKNKGFHHVLMNMTEKHFTNPFRKR